jgi:hypothetical protein
VAQFAVFLVALLSAILIDHWGFFYEDRHHRTGIQASARGPETMAQEAPNMKTHPMVSSLRVTLTKTELQALLNLTRFAVDPRTVCAPFSAYGSPFNLGPRPWRHHDSER